MCAIKEFVEFFAILLEFSKNAHRDVLLLFQQNLSWTRDTICAKRLQGKCYRPFCFCFENNMDKIKIHGQNKMDKTNGKSNGYSK